MKDIFRNWKGKRSQAVMLLLDLICTSAALYASLFVRLFLDTGSVPQAYLVHATHLLPCFLMTTLLCFWAMRLYARIWSYAGLKDAIIAAVACLIAAATLPVLAVLLQQHLPRSCYILTWLFLTAFTEMTRFAFHAFRSLNKRFAVARSDEAEQRVMIIGAGSAASILIREYATSSKIQNAKVICAIDDDPAKQGLILSGVRVIGGKEKLTKSVVKSHRINEIVFAIPSATPDVKRSYMQLAKSTGCTLRTLSGMYQMVSGEVSVSKLRKVNIADLLGREQIHLSTDNISEYITGKTVLVTGGGGSIGSELCRQIARFAPKLLIIFDIYENNAYDIQNELKKAYPDLELLVLIGSVRDTDRLDYLFRTYRPSIVYHAAAHKHVPLMEGSPNEAIKNNVFGTLNTVRAADQYGVRRFVLISTDKAVNPTNVMGATKRICEMIVQTYNNRSKTEFVAVRFGNVLGSNGSVIPLFQRQIEAGGPVTVTDPEIIRYFMTIPEAASLVLEAGAFAKGGEIFVLDMGEPVKILTLAENMIRLSGYTPYEDIPIVFCGLRPGEKIFEELLMSEEGLQNTENDLIHVGRPIQIDENRLFALLAELKAMMADENQDVRGVIKKLVSTYHYSKVPPVIVPIKSEAHVSEQVGQIPASAAVGTAQNVTA